MTQTTPFTKAQLRDALEQFADEAIVRKSYSGRAMYGANCFGVVHDASDSVIALAIVQAVADARFAEGDDLDVDSAVQEAYEIVREASGDNMGRSSITYFPGWELSASDEDDEDDDEDDE